MSPRTVENAAAQLKRLLVAIPTLGDEQAHPISELAEQSGASEEVVLRDLRSLVTRFDDGPGGFVEGVRLAFGSDTVQLQSKLFKRPMGLAADEIGALEVGLAALERELPPHEAAVAKRARDRLAAVAGEQSLRDVADGRVASQLVGSELEGELLNKIRAAMSARKKLEIVYRSGGSPAGAPRIVHPYRVAYSRGKWFLVGMCENAEEIRIFQVARIVSIAFRTEDAAIPESHDLARASLDARGMIDRTDERLIVRYSPNIARWISERELRAPNTDGSVTLEQPLLDDSWAVRSLLQYAQAAECLAPGRIRMLLQTVLHTTLQACSSGSEATMRDFRASKKD